MKAYLLFTGLKYTPCLGLEKIRGVPIFFFVYSREIRKKEKTTPKMTSRGQKEKANVFLMLGFLLYARRRIEKIACISLDFYFDLVLEDSSAPARKSNYATRSSFLCTPG